LFDSKTASSSLNSLRPADLGMFYMSSRTEGPEKRLTRAVGNSAKCSACATVRVSSKMFFLDTDSTPFRAPREWFSGPRCGFRRAWINAQNVPHSYDNLLLQWGTESTLTKRST